MQDWPTEKKLHMLNGWERGESPYKQFMLKLIIVPISIQTIYRGIRHQNLHILWGARILFVFPFYSLLELLLLLFYISIDLYKAYITSNNHMPSSTLHTRFDSNSSSCLTIESIERFWTYMYIILNCFFFKFYHLSELHLIVLGQYYFLF